MSITVKDANDADQVVSTIDDLLTRFGEVQASPTSNTLLDRVKALSTLIGEVQASPTSNTLLDRLKTLSTLIGEVQASPTANTILDRLKTLATNTGSQGYTSSVTVTRPSNTTAYTALDVLGDTSGSAILTFASIGPSAGHVLVTGADVRFDVTAVVSGMAAFRLHLYDTSPTAIADNAAFDIPSGDRAIYQGYIDLPLPTDFGSTLFSQADGVNKKVKLTSASTSLYGLLQTIGAWTPASAAVHAVRIHTLSV
jgi:hypothetical protein